LKLKGQLGLLLPNPRRSEGRRGTFNPFFGRRRQIDRRSKEAVRIIRDIGIADSPAQKDNQLALFSGRKTGYLW